MARKVFCEDWNYIISIRLNVWRWHFNDIWYQYSRIFHFSDLTHWGRVTHICVVKLTIIGSDNGLSPGRRQAIIWTNAGILLIGPLGTNFSEILIGIQIFSFKKMRLKMSSGKWRPFCLGLNVLKISSSSTSSGRAIMHCPSHNWDFWIMKWQI